MEKFWSALNSNPRLRYIVDGEPTGATPPDAPAPDDDPPDAGADALGDAGKQALDRMKAARNDERAKRQAAERELAELRAKAADQGKTPDQAAIDAARRDGEAAALAKANERIIRAELRAAAAGKLQDPGDALRFVELSAFEVGADGSVDVDALADAISDLVKTKPYLAAGAKQEPQSRGSADGGPRNAPGPRQLTRDDIRGMSPDAIEKARTEGQLNNLLGIK